MSQVMGTTKANCMEGPLTTMPGYAELERIVRADLHLMDLLCTAREINLPQCRVVAGCIYQSVWNVLTGRPRGTGINGMFFGPCRCIDPWLTLNPFPRVDRSKWMLDSMELLLSPISLTSGLVPFRGI